MDNTLEFLKKLPRGQFLSIAALFGFVVATFIVIAPQLFLFLMPLPGIWTLYNLWTSKKFESSSRQFVRKTQEHLSTKYKEMGECTESTTAVQQTKRKDYLSWDEYFMSVALLSAQRSKDPITQVGACIVNPDKRIVGIGSVSILLKPPLTILFFCTRYNGFPTGCDDDALPWGKNILNNSECKKENMGTDILNTKHLYVD